MCIRDRSSDDVVNKKLKMGTESFLKEAQLGKVTVLKQDDIDSWEKSTLKGEAFATPKIVEDLFQNQNKASEYQTRGQIFNRLLKASGATFQVPPGGEEKSLWQAKKLDAMIHNYKSMSVEDQERIACTQEILDLGDTNMCKERVARETAEREALEQYNYLQNQIQIEDQYTKSEVKSINKPKKKKLPWFMRPVNNSSNPVRLNRL